MLARPLVNRIARDEALVRGLSDPEARILVEWVVERADSLIDDPDGPETERRVAGLCRKGRAIARFVRLWCHDRSPGAAAQLAAAERFDWPLPSSEIDPCVLMQDILDFEEEASAPP